MNIAHTKKEVRNLVSRWKKAGETIGLVPTMGFLHQGHGSLIRRSVKENDHTVVSIFVNPMQFSKGEDLENYPRSMEKDTTFCEELGADVIFNPSPEEMYGQPFYTYTDMTVVTEGLCGKTRTNMFRGVCTVCSKLFHIAAPNKAYFGKKDAQQLAVMKQMVQDMDFDLEIIGCESVREDDGLAMSSRNAYLSEEHRKIAPGIYRALLKAKEQVDTGEHRASFLQDIFLGEIKKTAAFKPEYCQVVNGRTMKLVEEIAGDGSALMAVAVDLGGTRLIDNIEL